MLLKIFSVYDVKAHLHGPPFFVSTTAEALRAFKDLSNDSNTTVGRHSGDFELVQLGEFDNETGAFGCRDIIRLGFAADYKERPALQLAKEIAHG